MRVNFLFWECWVSHHNWDMCNASMFDKLIVEKELMHIYGREVKDNVEVTILFIGSSGNSLVEE